MKPFWGNIDPEVIKSFNKNMANQYAELNKKYEPLRKAIINFVTESQKALDSSKLLAEFGWYLPFDMPPTLINRNIETLKAGNSKLIDEAMVDFFDEEIDSIENNLVLKFPNRKAVLKAAFKAHKNRDYYLSIPVFYAQIDGICNELIGLRFFKLKKNQPATGQWASNFNEGTMLELLLVPLKQIGVNRQNQELSNPLGINRHDILHGDSVDYGEEKTNSYKALSLLNYVGETIHLGKEHILNQINNEKCA